jgi:CubicO group peptidase (beta-lactamase class C family)
MRGAYYLALLLFGHAAAMVAQQQDTALVGLWQSKRYFGAEVRGRLEIVRSGERWQASIGSRTAEMKVVRDSVSFDLPDAASFRGRMIGGARPSLVGQWIEPRRRIALPLVLASCGTGCYVGHVEPLEDEFTFYMEVKARADGKLGAFLRNPERNQGLFIRLDHLTRSGDTVHLRNARDTTLAVGLLRNGMLSVPLRFATHDFRKVPADSFTYYYPRGRPTGTYAYAPPRQRNDGWPVARARDVNLSEEKLAAMTRTLVNASRDSIGAFRPHGILIARHGKLVFEEYFHGEHADKPHNTRSASKTLTTVVLGAAMHAGLKVRPEAAVYATMGMTSDTMDARKRALTLRHLLTMSSGLDCDDNSPTSPAAENLVSNQDTNPDWKRLVLGVRMVRDPGTQAVYCSMSPFVAGEVIARATGRHFTDLSWELVGAPLQMQRHYIGLTPLGEAYMGGGAAFTLRDFAKLAQLYANGGTWNGSRILSESWVRESAQPRYRIGNTFRQTAQGAVATTENNYGYLWWTTTFEHAGRHMLAHHASGNGGQFSIYIPDLDLVVATFGGNYNDAGGFATLRWLIPQHILPAVVR